MWGWASSSLFPYTALFRSGGAQGSWVNLCVDPKGRIIASDQFGGLYRFSVPSPGEPLDPSKVEKVPAEIRAVNGIDRKSTRLNSSHGYISYAVFCLKKKSS